MLEKIDLSKKIDKETYKKTEKEQSEKLGLLQRQLKEAGIPVMIVFEGMGASGKGTQINHLIQALDPRGFDVYANDKSTDEERMRPFLWRFYTKLPAQGRIAVFDRSWYRQVTMERFSTKLPDEDLPAAFHDIQSFERQLTDDGMVIIKLFLYISREEQKKRFKKLENSKETSWRVTKDDWKRNTEYDRFLKICEEMLQNTDMDYAPWTIIEANDKEYAAAKIMSCVADCLSDALNKKSLNGVAKEKEVPVRSESFKSGVLSGVDLTKSISKEDYKKEIDRLQKKLEFLHSQIYRMRIPVVLGFEGWDAAGKGGAIKRLTSHLDPRGYKVYPTAAPNDLERVHHYLWRFWINMPKAGHIAIFDRTWYGRVLVERVEGFCRESQWKQAYQEINEMESHLANAGAVVLKFWLHIDKDEQEKRFKERQEDPLKQWKITEEDWRNREKWDQYESAVNEMLVRTSTTYAPWVVVEGNCKYYARIKILKTVVEALENKIKEVNNRP
ncbi:polyphosphate:AMP phosphotransferase [Lacrimispora xylanisolvens]|uniref:Polyphosphate:AMP phosphotransferase n=1 Tax=Lacrimispora xylanisolvens TaxID=384636 RepID=A0A2S6HUG2_9FIRM|nr:polyphosphate:AMP phosphotransferase [Hungatella xylanolytica]PPK81468.1 polyphosphate:AMP phosphotransferase [Hungatella xylanolytica]